MLQKRQLVFLLLLAAVLASSCASTGPKVTKDELAQKEEAFHEKFLEASNEWLPRVYRVGYTLINSPVPGHGSDTAEFNFAGVGVAELDEALRKTLGIDKKTRGVLVQGIYPGSRAEGIDLRLRDVITHVDGKKVKGLGSYFKKIRKTQKPEVALKIWRKGEILERTVPLEKVYYNAQFFLAATPHLDAHAAFSKIGIGIGAIRYCRNDDELAVIMGHELAHTTLKHSLKKMGAGVSTAVAYGVAAGVINAFTFPGIGDALLYPVAHATDAAVSRRYEREADYFGMKHAFHSGYDVESGSRVFARLATDTPGFEVLAYTFSSHPKTTERFLRLEKIVEEFKAHYPERFPLTRSPDWEFVIPLERGESLDEALTKLIEKKAEFALDATTNETSTASLPSLDIDPAFGYPAPRKS